MTYFLSHWGEYGSGEFEQWAETKSPPDLFGLIGILNRTLDIFLQCWALMIFTTTQILLVVLLVEQFLHDLSFLIMANERSCSLIKFHFVAAANCSTCPWESWPFQISSFATLNLNDNFKYKTNPCWIKCLQLDVKELVVNLFICWCSEE